MLNYEQFKEKMVNELLQYMPDKFQNMEVCVEVTTRVNQVLDGLYLKNRLSDIVSSPKIYIEEFYQKYLLGENFEMLIQMAAEIMTFACIDNIKFPTMDADYVRSKVVFQMINTDKNRELLDNVPHRQFLDLSIVYSLLLNANDNGIATFRITNQILEQAQLSEEELFHYAVQNTKTQMHTRIIPMELLLEELINRLPLEESAKMKKELEQTKTVPQMWILTNGVQNFGSGILLYKDIFEKVATSVKNDLYIFPSSRSELIVTPVDDKELDYYLSMVREINKTVVKKDEWLSDEVYYYSLERKNIYLATEILNPDKTREKMDNDNRKQ